MSNIFQSDRFRAASAAWQEWGKRAWGKPLRCPDCAAVSGQQHDVECPSDSGAMPCREFRGIAVIGAPVAHPTRPVVAIDPRRLDEGSARCRCGAIEFQHWYWEEHGIKVAGE